MKTIVVADDFGMTPGTNAGILEAHLEGCVTHASVMINAPYAQQAVQEAQRNTPNLQLGLHFNLSYGKALSGVSSITDDKGFLRYGFEQIFFLAPVLKKIRIDIEKELQAQIAQAEQWGLSLSHIDSQRHVHLIPAIWRIVKKHATEKNISQIRVMNESFVRGIKRDEHRDVRFIMDSIKYVVLALCTRLNKAVSDREFVSILYTGRMSERIIKEALAQDTPCEIMVHPSKPDLDRDVHMFDEVEKKYRLSEDRILELEACKRAQK